MTGKRLPRPAMDLTLKEFPGFPKRHDMQNVLHIHEHSHMPALSYHLGKRDTTFVLGETPVSPTSRNRSDVRVPDLIVSFNCNPTRVKEHWGYAIDEQGKPPDWVLTIAPLITDFNRDCGTLASNLRDYTDQRRDYERYGVAEYWRLDPTGGDYYGATLAGDRLVNGRYQPIHIEWLDAECCRGYSQALDLYICWEYGKWRWHNPNTGAYLPTHDELFDRAEQERERANKNDGFLLTYQQAADFAKQAQLREQLDASE